MARLAVSPSAGRDGGPIFQPFQCLVCQTRFTRHENLKRHAALHSRSQDAASLRCEICEATFSRPDLRRRHMKRKHPEHREARPVKKTRRQASASTHGSDGGRDELDGVLPASPAESRHSQPQQNSGDEDELEIGSEFCETALWTRQRQLDHRGHHAGNAHLATARPGSIESASPPGATAPRTQPPSMREPSCMSHMALKTTALDQNLLLEASFLKMPLHLIPASQPAPSDDNLTFDFHHDIPHRLLSNVLPQLQNDWYPSTSQITQGCDLFFNHVSRFVPFLHQPTFDSSRLPPHLVLGILSLGYQYGEDPESGDQPGTGVEMSSRCFHAARCLLTSQEDTTDDLAHSITTVQTCLLLQICAMMYLCGPDSTHGMEIHSKMIALARAGGLMMPLPVEAAATEGLEELWREFVKAESHKRTLFALHQIDALWYQFLSMPRQVSHLEVKHELPCPEDHWTASSAAEWAHRQLAVRHSGPALQYSDAVRRFLSPDGDLGDIPPFDQYGAINIAQFLISSSRETSGWSTMTGMLSMERIEPLRASLVALSPFIHPKPETANATHAALCEATWEAAMIELQMWSPSHTGGIVGGSMDAVLEQSTYLAPSCSFLRETNTAKAIRPHVDWFLHYLEATISPDSEAPWIALHAYKAFLVAWKLVCGGASGAMQIVGIQDNDAESALRWAKKVFQRRQRWQLGRLILASLDTLER